MRNIHKILIGVGIVAVGAVIIHKVTKDDDYISYSIDPETKEPVYKKKEKTDSRIKKAVEDKVTQILAFVIVHRDQIEAIGTVIGLVGGAIGIVNAVKEYKTRDKNTELLEKIWEHNLEFEGIWDEYATRIFNDIGHVEHILKEG